MSNETTNKIEAIIKEYAHCYHDEFPGQKVDEEWSGTGYSDLPELHDEIDWYDFHVALEEAVEALNRN